MMIDVDLACNELSYFSSFPAISTEFEFWLDYST